MQFSGGLLEGGDDRDLIRYGAQRGFRGVPESGAWMDRFLSGALDYQIPLWSGGLGTWTVAPFCDAGITSQPLLERGQLGGINH